MEIPDGALVYCDPPYEGTAGYKDAFDNSKFWTWVRKLSLRCTVFVSEYKAPPDFNCVWSKNRKVTLHNASNKISKQRVEKLFVWSGASIRKEENAILILWTEPLVETKAFLIEPKSDKQRQKLLSLNNRFVNDSNLD